ncbi:MAG: 50S ribosomal protein L32 [Planctomycetes bacterium]|jgi:large subunit ribosomal protein L32|nr:50S ribosomal protein L32 [Planctomycetota bacterium]
MLPTQKLSRSRTRSRRAHHARRPANLSDCPKCNKAKLPHAACDNCGYVRPGLSLETKKES